MFVLNIGEPFRDTVTSWSSIDCMQQ